MVEVFFETTTMPTLELSFRDKSIGSYPLQRGNSMTIGRQKSNDIVIENLAVSSHHAKIDSVGEAFVLIDLQSKNGLFVNEKKVGSHWLKQGDVISIGKHSLAFCYSDDEKQPENESDIIEKTMAMDTIQYRSMLNKNQPADKSKAANEKEPDTVRLPKKEVKGSDTVGILIFLAGGSGKHVCRTSTINIGKHPDSDVVVKGFMVGSTSATISRTPDGFYLRYISGMSRPRVNANKVNLEMLLNDRDIIEIGSCKLQFFERKPIKSKKKQPKKQPTPQESPQ